MTKKWDYKSTEELFELPIFDLILQAQQVHRANFVANEIELCSLLSIKTGSCPEDCAYCPQSGHYKTYVEKEKILDSHQVLHEAKIAKENGATRFCMGAAWRNPPDKHFAKVVDMIEAVKSIGLETCATLGMLTENQATELKQAGLDFYNHNLDTSPQFYEKIISTRTYQDRLETLKHVRNSGIKVCCGGIIGMGESRQDRIELLIQLANLPIQPESVPINRLLPIKGTPLENAEQIDNFEFIRTIAVARIMMSKSMIRLSAGRITMSEEMQALCFLAGANSIWLGNLLLTAKNPSADKDEKLFATLGLKAKKTALSEYVNS